MVADPAGERTGDTAAGSGRRGAPAGKRKNPFHFGKTSVAWHVDNPGGSGFVTCLRILMMIAAALPLWPAAGFAQSFQASSTWTNQVGSTLTIEAITPNGAFTGTYVNQAGDIACRSSPYRANGWIDGQKIAFSVRWTNATANCQGITSWSGFIGPKGLLTQWTIVHYKKGEPAFTSGKDIFH